MQNSNLIFIEELEPDKMSNQEVYFMVLGSNNAGTQKLVFDLTYKDEKLTPFSKRRVAYVCLSV